MRIDWDVPEPRSGFLGSWDKFAGTGYTVTENRVVFGVALFLSVVLMLHAAIAGAGWTWWQYLVAFVLAVDIVGGAVTMAASPGKRWYHRPGQTIKDHRTFIAVHVHPFIVGLLFIPDGGWLYGSLAYGYLIAGTWLLLGSKQYLHRPLATALVCGGCFLNGMLEVPAGFEWFLPVFYIKLFLSHLVREEPYRPE